MPSTEAVHVRIAADGQLEILEPSDRDGSMRVRARGVCPTAAHVFGMAMKNSQRLVGTVAGSVATVVLDLSDGSSHRCPLRDIDDADAQYFVVSLSKGMHAGTAVAEADDGRRIAEFDFSRGLL